MPGSRLMLCGGCRLLWFPEDGTTADDCPACRAKARRIPRLFHVGVLVIAAGLALGAFQLSGGSGRFWTAGGDAGVGASADASRTARAGQAKGPRAQAPRQARVKARLVLEVTSGPRRGGTVTLQRGEQVSVVKKERGGLLVQDRKGNQMWVKQEQVTPL